MTWGIDVEGRRMKFEPWPIDASGEYRKPDEKEIEATYGISGEAVAETLDYFESVGGNAGRLVELLNAHVLASVFHIDRNSLSDPSRWYTNEYYFYFIMFTKKLIGRYDFRFGEGTDTELSKYHKIYERGFLLFPPYGKGYQDVSNGIPFAINKYYSERLSHFSDFLDWANLLCVEKNVLSYKESVLPIKDVWINSEFMYFLYEFSKVLSNSNDLLAVVLNCCTLFRYFSSTNIPNSLLPPIFEKLLNFTTNALDVKVSGQPDGILVELHRKKDFSPEKYGQYVLSVREDVHKVVISGVLLGLKNSLKLSEFPRFQLYGPIENEELRFKAIFSRPSRFPNWTFFIGIVIIWFILYLVFGERSVATMFAYCLGMTASLTWYRFFLLYLQERKNSKLYIDQNVKNVVDKENTINELKSLSIELLTEKKHLEDKVRERTAEIEEANRKLREYDKSKTEFFYNVSHELRTPLTLIKAPVEALIGGQYGKTLKADSDLFKMILRNADRLGEQVDILLDFAKIDQKRMAPEWASVDLRALCGFYVAQLEPRAALAEISLVTSFPEKLAAAKVDVKLFDRVFFNLALNAIKFTRRGGTVEIRLSDDGEAVTFKVADTGIGIPSDKLDVIFERFVQLDGSSSRGYGGAGLGLSLVKGVCDILGATISVESRVGVGSTFTVRFQRTEEKPIELKSFFMDEFGRSRDAPTAGAEATPPDRIEAQGPRPTIMVVEDTPDMGAFIAALLRDRYEVINAADGTEAIDIFKERGSEVDLIVSDVMMPLMDGHELYRRLVLEHGASDIPFLFVTARASDEEMIDVLGQGAVDYLIKPFRPGELVAKIGAHIAVMVNRERHIREELAAKVVDLASDFATPKPRRRKLSAFDLSPREREVAVLLLEGKRNRDIATKLNLSISTIAHHVEAIYKKTGAAGRLEFINRVES